MMHRESIGLSVTCKTKVMRSKFFNVSANASTIGAESRYKTLIKQYYSKGNMLRSSSKAQRNFLSVVRSEDFLQQVT